MINFYRRFLPGIAGVLQPLTDLLRGNPKTLVWSDAAAAAFSAGKNALAKCTVLVHPSPGATISLAVDASDSHVGGVLQQLSSSGSWSPLAFFSRKLSSAEVKYSTFDRELLAAFSAVRHFRFVLEGRNFRLLTDHMPLTHAMNRVSPLWSARQVRQMAYISEFTTDLRHVPGPQNVVADALSRPSASPPPPFQATVHKSTLKNVSPKSGSVIDTNPDLKSNLVATLPISTPIDYVQMASLQHSCTECTQMCNSTVLFVVTRKIGETLLRGDISKNVFRPLVPVSMRSAVIAAIHNVAHPGVEATVRLVTAKFCWPKMAKQIRLFSQQCIFCQRAKISTHVHLAPAVIPVPQRRFEHVHVDLVGPLPTSSGFTYLFTVVDRTTRWPEAIPLSGISAADCAAALFSGWIQRFGVPAYITSDRGAQFTSSLWTSLCSLLSITHLQTTAYHPQSNGLVERFHRRLKDSLRARLAGADWLAHLPWVL
jgi:cleavage and polyadenylation specificity factor subunit 1